MRVNNLFLKKLLRLFNHFICLFIFLILPYSIQAATFTVTNTNDSGAGSLREAITDANDNDEADVINFDLSLNGATITLTSGEITVGRVIHNDALIIDGTIDGDPTSITIDANNNSRIFNVISANALSGSLTLNNMTLTHGSSTPKGGAIVSEKTNLFLNHVILSDSSTSDNSAKGGGIFSKNGNITLTNTTIMGNSTSGTGANGGGIFVELGSLSLMKSAISNNTTTGENSEGGGISASNITINQSTINSNSTSGSQSEGGGIFASSNDLSIYDSTLSNNFTRAATDASGGALYLTNGDLIIEQSTISDNYSLGALNTGGIFVNEGDISIINSTIVNNTSPSSAGGLSVLNNSGSGFSVVLINTVLAQNTGVIDGNFLTDGTGAITVNVRNSLFGDPSNEINGISTAVIFDNNPDLGLLLNNGGSTETHLPNATSPVIDNGDNFFTILFDNDQRGIGFNRILHGTMDIGAVEKRLPITSNEVIKRGEMAKALLQAITPSSYQPPAATGNVFTDIGANDVNAAWIEEYADRGYTEGCGGSTLFCPNMVVTREDMAQAIGKVYTDTNELPPHNGFDFDDVKKGSFNYDWITYIREKGFTEGCDSNNFCPKQATTKQWLDFLLTVL